MARVRPGRSRACARGAGRARAWRDRSGHSSARRDRKSLSNRPTSGDARNAGAARTGGAARTVGAARTCGGIGGPGPASPSSRASDRTPRRCWQSGARRCRPRRSTPRPPQPSHAPKTISTSREHSRSWSHLCAAGTAHCGAKWPGAACVAQKIQSASLKKQQNITHHSIRAKIAPFDLTMLTADRRKCSLRIRMRW